ncbi:aldehyde dehydrogenase [Streptomyces spiralis]|uniref:Aldehyde dehydrogenase n=1 Tax=Streptomyces spiralis TaxID=66376 RepID=A0A919AIK4_9ACTN|nr:aldehyde dehydrogenase family protein [Streptomyces spiralis]GHF09481.1 aldehyde dehydrogenase [Streptomyces spiralis]
MTAPTPPSPYTGFDRMLIAGEWRAGSSSSPLVDADPYTGETVTEIPLADHSDADAAYRAAKEAQRAWASTAPGQRAGVFERAARIIGERQAEIVDWLVREAGATPDRAAVEVGIVQAITAASVGYTEDVMVTTASMVPDKENRVYRRPAGVVTVISPWNWPLWLTNRSVAPALALGNAVVIKPAEDTPVTGGLILAKIFEEAGLPAGLLSVVVGRGSEVGDFMVAHEVPRVISFTGSTRVGKGIITKAGIKRLSLELGGNGPLVVLDDADLDRAVECAVFGSYYHQGQICMATNRVIVDASVYDEFVERFVGQARALRVGDPRDPGTQIGPIISQRQFGSVKDKIERTVAGGGRLVLSGEAQGPTGLVLPPHVVLGDNTVATAAEEVFGPVATLILATDEEDALRIANDTDAGLSSGVFTQDVERGLNFALRVEAGMTHINDTTVHDDVNIAFGGEKASGLGRFGGHWVAEEFTTQHWVSIQHKPRPLTY